MPSIGRLPLLSGLVLSVFCLSFSVAAAETNNSPPTAYIAGYVNSDKSLHVYEEILLVGMGEDADGDALSYAWDFGDGTTGVGEMVYHRYPRTGTYTAVLTVSDGLAEASDRRTLQIFYQTIVSYPSAPLGDTQIVRPAEVNYGGTDSMYVYNGEYPDYRALLSFDVGARPANPSDDAYFLGSFLELSCLEGNPDSPKTQVFGLTRSWAEGTGMAGGNSGATWQTYDGSHAWTRAGGDYNATADFGYGPTGVVAEARVRDEGAWVSYDVTALVEAWWIGTLPNYGVLIGMAPEVYYKRVEFASSEFEADPARRPALTHKYTVGNFVRNSEAKQDFQHWLKTANTQAVVVAEDGDKTFKIAKSSPEGSLYQRIDLSKADDIDSETLQLKAAASMRSEIEGASGGAPFLKVQVYGKAGALLAETATPVVSSTTETRLTVSLPLPSGADNAVVSLKRSPAARRGTTNPGAYFDTISLSLSPRD